MIGWLLLVVGLVVVRFVAGLAYRIIKSKVNLEFYKKQGCLTRFDARRGQFSLFDPEDPENKKDSCNEHLKRLVNEWKGVKAIASNNRAASGISIYLYSSDLIKEFLIKEDQFAKQNIFQDEALNRLGLFFQNGETMFRSKALFMKIFAYEGMEGFTSRICRLIHSEFAKFNEQKGINKQEFTRATLDDLFKPIMLKITNFLVFGKEEFAADSDESKMHKLLEQIINTFPKIKKNPLMLFIPKLGRKLNLISEFNQLKSFAKQQEQLIERIISRRKESPEPLGQCIIDRIIAHNQECEKSGNTKDIMDYNDIAGNYNLFQFAGSDTSQNTTKIALCFMADKPELKAIIEQINKEIYDQEGVTHTDVMEKCELLNLWIKEALRIHSPITRMAVRCALQDVQIGNLKVKKDDFVVLLPGGLNFDEQYFADAKSFQLQRFAKESEKLLPRYQYIPFSLGKRVCLGRHLGELMVKLLVTQFCKSFEFAKPADVDYYQTTRLANMIANPIVLLKSK